MRWRDLTPALLLVVVAATIGGAGCGRVMSGSASTPSRPPAAPCLPALGALLGHELGRPVRLTDRIIVPAVLTCTYSAVGEPTSACGTAMVVVDTDPQPYTDFNRWEVETGQTATQSGNHDLALYPALVGGIGIAADWVPAPREFDAVNLSRWVRIFLTCPNGVSGLDQAEALARIALTEPLD